MSYLESVVKETLRMYPSLPFVERKCVKKNGYKLDDKLTLPHGMQIICPTYSIQRDPMVIFQYTYYQIIVIFNWVNSFFQYFENPDQFDPERFSPENINNIQPYTYFPFGIGTRNCIGERLGLLQVKVGIFNFLRNHKVALASYQSPFIEFEVTSITLKNIGGLNISFERDVLF